MSCECNNGKISVPVHDYSCKHRIPPAPDYLDPILKELGELLSIVADEVVSVLTKEDPPS